ncbi:glycosyltransferase family 2 protein [Candidatus Bathyarchaeota archaeon]|nr:glycosyltransferase family 2 protein [Candidatus Bathyarchaeota archaeon]
MKKPLISVIMPVYNEEKTIKKAVESVLKQTYREIELIIIDDASIDSTPKIISELAKEDDRIVMLRNSVNRGITHSLNRGLRKASGKYIARIDGDDWYHPRKLELQMTFLEERGDYGIVGTFYVLLTGDKMALKINLPITHDEILRQLAYRNAFAHSSIMVRKDILDTVGYYDERYEYAQDYDLYFRILSISKGYNIPKYLLFRRLKPQNRKTLTKRTINSIMIPLRYRKVLGKYTLYYPLLIRRVLSLLRILALPL